MEAPTRAEALRRAQKAAANLIAQGELVQIEITSQSSARPLASFAGMWADDETFGEFVAAMAAYRREVDVSTSQP